jgi:hypothetical protein
MPELTIYVDEAGDPGAKDGLRFLGDRYEWLTFGAVAVRTSRDLEIVDWVKDLRQVANARLPPITKLSRCRAQPIWQPTNASASSVLRMIAGKRHSFLFDRACRFPPNASTACPTTAARSIGCEPTASNANGWRCWTRWR